MLFALFGKAGKRPEELIYDLADSMSVEFTFRHNSQLIVVKRSVERTKPQKLKITVDGKDLSERLFSKTQEKLDEILGISYDLLLATSVAQQDEINILSTMGPSDREKILSEMLQIETWENKKKVVNTILTKNQDLAKNISTKEQEVQATTNISLQTQETLENLRLCLNANKATQATLTAKASELSEALKRYEEFVKLRSKYAVLTGVILGLENQLKTLPSVNEEASQKLIVALKEGIEENKELLEEIKTKSTGLKEIDKSLNVELEKANWMTKLEPQTKILDDVPCVGLEIHDRCQLLKNSLDAKTQIANELKVTGFTSLKAWIDDIASRRKTNDDHKHMLEEGWMQITANNTKLETKITEEIKNTELARKREPVSAELAKHLKDKEELENLLQVTPEFNAEAHNETLRLLKAAGETVHSTELDIARNETYLAGLYEKNQKNQEELKLFYLTRDQLANYQTLYRAYNEIPSLLFEEAIPFIEEYTNKILDKIAPGRRVQLRAFKDTKAGTQQKSLDVIGMTATGLRDFHSLLEGLVTEMD